MQRQLKTGEKCAPIIFPFKLHNISKTKIEGKIREMVCVIV